MNPIVQVLFVLWLVLSVVIGILATRRTKSYEDYLVAGRNIGPFLYGVSMIATAMTPAVFVGFAGQLYAFGNSIVYWMILPLGIAFSLSLCVFAPKIRRFGKFTVSDYLAARYDSNTIRVLSSIIIIIFGILYSVQITMGTAVIVANVFGWSWTVSCIVVTLVSFLFTFLSGLVGIIWNSVQFTIVFAVGTLAVVPFVLSKAGSLPTIVTNIEASLPGFFSLFGHNPKVVILPVAISWAITMLTGNSIFNPAALSRHYVARNEKVPVRASLIAGLSMVAVYIPCFLTLYGGISLYPTLKDPESLYIMLCLKDVPVWAGSIAL
jgi:SSS family solute:Na+ symporter